MIENRFCVSIEKVELKEENEEQEVKGKCKFVIFVKYKWLNSRRLNQKVTF